MNVDEMARGYMYIHTLEDICANPFTRMKDAYKAGAMAVLREMEHYANMEDGCYAFKCIQMRINELKEE